MRRCCGIQRARSDAGVTLIEVLIALLVLSFGLLGLAMMQAAGLRFTTDSYSRSQGTYFAYDIIERMRVNPTGFDGGHYDIADTSDAEAKINAYEGCKDGACDCDANACDPANLALYDLGKWYEQQDRLLPGTRLAANEGHRATIERAGNLVTVTMQWWEQDTLKSQVWQAQF